MIITSNLRKYYCFSFLIVLVFVFVPSATAQKYSIDKEITVKKRRTPFSIKRLFKKDEAKAAAKQVRKDDKHRIKVQTQQQKNNKTYQKNANDNNEKGENRKVYTRMKSYEKQANRRRKNKPTKNFFQRLFSKSKPRRSL